MDLIFFYDHVGPVHLFRIEFLKILSEDIFLLKVFLVVLIKEVKIKKVKDTQVSFKKSSPLVVGNDCFGLHPSKSNRRK